MASQLVVLRFWLGEFDFNISHVAFSRWSRSRKHLDHDVREVCQLVVVGQKHITARLDGGGEMEGIGQSVSPWLRGWDCRVSVAAPDSTGPGVHCSSQPQCSQVRPMEEAEKVGKSLTAARAENWNQAFRAGQFTDGEPMAGLFERGQVI